MSLFTRVSLFIILFSSLNWGQLLYQENFNYTPGTTLIANGWLLWGSSSGTGSIYVSPQGLSKTGYLGSGIGGSASLANTGEEDRSPNWTSAVTAGNCYVSFLVNVTTADTGDYFFFLTNSSNHTRARVYAKFSGTGFDFGIGRGGAAPVQYTGNTYNLNQTYLVVLRYMYATLPVTTDDSVALWVDPVLNGIEPAPTIPNFTDGATDFLTFNRVGLRQGAVGLAPFVLVDGIRVGTTWAQVLPPPPYYYNGIGNLTDVNSWGIELDGTGTHPTDFTSNDQMFVIQNIAATLSTPWTISGTNSKLYLGSNSSLLISTTGSYNGIMDIAGSAILTISSPTLSTSTLPTFGTVSGIVSFSNPSGFVLGSDITLPYGTGTYELTQGNIDVAGFTFNVAGRLDCLTNTVFGAGTFNLLAAASLHIGSPQGITLTEAQGNIQTAVRNYSTLATYQYKSTGADLFTGNGLPSSVNSFIINLGSKNDIISLNSSVQTTGNIFTFTRGRLKLGNYDLSTSSVTGGGGSDSGYVITNGAGRVIRKQTPSSSTGKTFHVGSETEYRKIVVTFPSTTGLADTSNINVQYKSGDPGSFGYPVDIFSHYTGGSWNINMDIPPVNPYNLDVETFGIPGANLLDSLRMLKRPDALTAWDYAGTGHSYVGTIISETGCLGFSQFAVGGDEPFLPIDPLNVTANAISTTQIDVAFTPNTQMNNVIIVWNLTGSFTTPTGTPPAIGEPFAGGTLLSNGTTSPVNHTGLTVGTTYYYRLFSYEGTFYSPGITVSAITSSNTFQLSVDIMNGWNMVSVPGLHPTNQSVDTWWVNRNPQASVYKWSGSYAPVTSTTPKEGYWMLHNGAQTYNTGDEWPSGGIQLVAHDPVPISTGWNMIGAYDQNVPVAGLTTTPPGLIVAGTIYGWTGSYSSPTNLVPGYGYWVLVNGDGVINVGAKANGIIAKEDNKDKWGKITVTDASGKNYTLYSVKGEVDLNHYLLPPSPPEGVFDVRFTTGRKAEDLKSNKTIEMKGLQYPVTVTFDKAVFKVQDETGRMLNKKVKAGETIKINSGINKLLVSENMVPEVYSMSQNYPNPFNPSTTIQFSIPEDVRNASLIIYDALGQKVAELVNGSMEAGYYQYQWNASNTASGLYIYQLRTEKFVSTKKMMLLK